VTLFDESFYEFSPYAIKSFEKFAAINGFKTLWFDKLWNTNADPYWNKPYIFLRCFELDYEWVFWADADSIYIGDSPISLDDSRTFVTNSDSNGMCLSHLLVKNTHYNRNLLKTITFLGDVRDDSEFGIGRRREQNALKAIHRYFNTGITHFHPEFVKEPKYSGQPTENTQFVHYAVTEKDERKILMSETYKQYYGGTELPPYDKCKKS
jgi:hypothetical protein